MYKDIDPLEAHNILKANRYGHLAFCDADQPYTLPITYIVDGTTVYSYTFEGHKVSCLRKNPKVCLQVQELHNEHEWKSVVALGTFEELGVQEKVNAIQKLKSYTEFRHVFTPITEQETTMQKLEEGNNVIVYKITVDSVCGKTHKKEE